MSDNYNAIIIGAGIIGCCIAYELSKNGYRHSSFSVIG